MNDVWGVYMRKKVSDKMIKELLKITKETHDNYLQELEENKKFTQKRYESAILRIQNECHHTKIKRVVNGRHTEFIDGKMFITEQFVKTCVICGKAVSNGRLFMFHKDLDPYVDV